MMKINTGDYIRIKWGNNEQTISKVTNVVEIENSRYCENDCYCHTDKQGEVIYKSNIVKSSPNIIELIEVGDYVNGYLVKEIKLKCDGTIKVLITDYKYDICECHIKSIVTKEQMEQMQYEVK